MNTYIKGVLKIPFKSLRALYLRFMTTKTTALILLCLASHLLAAQQDPKVYSIQKTQSPPTIDGYGGDDVWQSAPIADGFRMLEPDNGPFEPAGRTTEVQLTYDDEAIYVFARMYDSEPDAILSQYSQRDVYNVNTDWFGIFINPFNDGISDFNFYVTAAGVQTDSRTTANGDDISWNTVWESEIRRDETGWSVELKIPYQCLRFSDKDVDDWGLNMIRYVRRTREMYSWNFIDRSIATYELQTGRLRGMNDIDPPIRLTFMPYLSAYDNVAPDGTNTLSANFGMDLKYGINESFTLDATLIPDFGQVAFDQQLLNISPFENQFQENRQFFVEGIDLFSKGNLFYSRRIGGDPKNITNADGSGLNNLTQDYTRILNATKISGRTSDNLGIGFLNAITDNNYLVGQDSLGNEVRILSEPLTNYNVIVFDQRLDRNKSISLVNTNVIRNGEARDANVTALVADINNNSNTYNFIGQFKYSSSFDEMSSTNGISSQFRAQKIQGNWRWAYDASYIDDKYNQNDLGFLARNNELNNYINGSYQIFQPRAGFNRLRIDVGTGYKTLADPTKYERWIIDGSFFAVTKNFFAFGGDFGLTPIGEIDYFEPRSPGRTFNKPSGQNASVWISSDYRKPFAIDSRIRYESWNGDFGYQFFLWGVKPIVRVNDRWNLFYDFVPRVGLNNVGWATSQNDSIIFGRRDITTVEQTFGSTFIFTPRMSLNLNFRHYWRALKYNQYYNLEQDGDLTALNGDFGRDLNFNTLNLDLRFSWWFRPGSELILLYRNTLINYGDEVDAGYFENFSNSISTPSTHIFSIRLTYFLDYAIFAR